MEKIKFTLDTQEDVELYVLEQTTISGNQYILVTDVEEGDGEALILKEVSMPDGQQAVYEVVEDDAQLAAVAAVFENLLEDVKLT